MSKSRWVRPAIVAGLLVGGLLGGLADLTTVADALPKYWRRLFGGGNPDIPAATATQPPVSVTPITTGSLEMHRSDLSASPTPRATENRATLVTNPTQPPPAPKRGGRVSSRLALGAGEQQILLEGRLGVAVAFSRVAGTPIATLRINREGGQENHAVLSSGQSFVVMVDGTRLRVSIVHLDLDREQAVVQVDELID